MDAVADAGHRRIETPAYRLHVSGEGPFVDVAAPDGTPIARLALLADADSGEGLDGVVGVGDATVSTSADGPVVTVEVESGRWGAKRIVLVAARDGLRLRLEIEGHGTLADVRLLGGRHPGSARFGSGLLRSSFAARTLFNPSPEDPRLLALDPARPAVISSSGGSQPGRGHWFYIPAPTCFAFTSSAASRPDVLPAGPWTTVAVASAVEDQTFTELGWDPIDGGVVLRLAYEGQTDVDGRWVSPWVELAFGFDSPYDGLAGYRAGLARQGWAPESAPSPRPAWWREPIFCGWGAQAALAAADGSGPAAYSTQRAYDGFLAELDRRGLDPGTIVIDDRWQAEYGSGEVDSQRWPDLGAWIARRHDRGQRVLLWWKAWDPEGVPPDLCVTTAAGDPVAVDPSHPGYATFVRERIRALLAPPPDGIGADGLKIDFLARTPSGPGLRRHGPEWGIALVHRLLGTLFDAAKAARPDALVVAHAPHPAFADVADMVRLNDILRLDEPTAGVPVVAQMRHRAAIATASCPGLLVETDDWCLPDRATWRAYQAMKTELGVPSLYSTTHLDLSGEPLTDEDAALVRESWSRYRIANGLPGPVAALAPIAAGADR